MNLSSCAAAFLVLSLPALAQSRAPDKVFTPAPVPGIGPQTVTPADRAGPIGADSSSPFAGNPVTLEPGAGQPTPINRGSGSTAPSPNLGK